MQVSDAALKPWIQGNLKNAEAILSRELDGPSHHALANRALVRTHLKQWDTAIEDVKKALPSLFPSLSYLPHYILVPRHQTVGHCSHRTRRRIAWQKRNYKEACTTHVRSRFLSL